MDTETSSNARRTPGLTTLEYNQLQYINAEKLIDHATANHISLESIVRVIAPLLRPAQLERLANLFDSIFDYKMVSKANGVACK